jgi:hypothetical protein
MWFSELHTRAGNPTAGYRNAMTAAAAAEQIGFKIRAAEYYTTATLLNGQGPTFTWHQVQQLLAMSAALSIDAKSWLPSGEYATLKQMQDESLVNKQNLGVRSPGDEHRPLQAVPMSVASFPELPSPYLECAACSKKQVKMNRCSRCKQASSTASKWTRRGEKMCTRLFLTIHTVVYCSAECQTNSFEGLAGPQAGVHASERLGLVVYSPQ